MQPPGEPSTSTHPRGSPAGMRGPVPIPIVGLDERDAVRSVAELEGLDVPPGAYGMGSLAWLSRALVSPLRDLGPAELRLLVAHGRGLRWLVPAALTRLEIAPFVAGDHHPGDLLVAVLLVDETFWRAHDALRTRLADVVDDARTRLDELPEPLRSRLADDLGAARELLGV